MKRERYYSFRVSGRRALFSDPVNRIGGEKISYLIPTYQALKGITESIYWKPSIIWTIHRLRIMNSIQTEVVGIRPIKFNKSTNDLAYYTYLKNVDYHVEVSFDWNKSRPELASDWNFKKHEDIFLRSLKKGGRRDIFIGTRECPGYVEPYEFDDGKGEYDEIETMSFGVQFHSFIYPDEHDPTNSDYGKLITNLWIPELKGGIINFIKPNECTMHRTLRDYNIKVFKPGENFQFVEEMNSNFDTVINQNNKEGL